MAYGNKKSSKSSGKLAMGKISPRKRMAMGGSSHSKSSMKKGSKKKY